MIATPSSVNHPDDSKQGRAPDETGEILAREARALLVMAEKWPEAKHLSGAFLICLCQLTLADPKQAATGFDADQIREGMETAYRRGWAKAYADDPEALGKRVRKELWRGVCGLWEQKVEGIRQKLADQGASNYLKPDRSEGGGSGNPTRYRLSLGTLANDPSEALPSPVGPAPQILAPGEIRYILEDAIQPHWFARWLSDGQRPDWEGRLFIRILVALIICLTIFAIVAIFLVFFGTQSGMEAAKVAFASIAILAISWSEIGPLVDVAQRRILPAPNWMQSGKRDFLLEWRPEGKSPGSRTKVVRYEANCPLCAGLIVVGRGGLRMPGRLMGKCENSPREHVFTFDHMTRKGKSLN